MAFTVLQIVDTALAQAGLDSGFRSKARGWLNLILDQQASDFKWPEWNKLASFQAFTPGTSTYALPTDFQRADTVYLYSLINGVYQRGNQVFIVDSYKFDAVDWGTLSGLPTMAYIDTLNQNIVFNSSPNDSTKGYKLRYFKVAEQYSTSGADDSLIPVFQDPNFLIGELVKWCYEFSDDERYQAKGQENEKDLKETKRNIYENDATPQVNLQQFNFRPRRRR